LKRKIYSVRLIKLILEMAEALGSDASTIYCSLTDQESLLPVGSCKRSKVDESACFFLKSSIPCWIRLLNP